MYFFPKAVLPWSLRASDSLIWESVEVIGEGEAAGSWRIRREALHRAKSLFLNTRGGSLAVPIRTLVHGTVSL